MKNDMPSLAHEKLAIGGMRCAACSQIIEFRLSRLPGVSEFRINSASHRADVSWNPRQVSLHDIIESITSLGYSALPSGAKDTSQEKQSKLDLWRLFIAGFAMMQVMMYAFPAYLVPVPTPDGDLTPDIDRLLKLASLVIATPVTFFSANPFYRSAVRAIRNRRIGMDVPVSIGVIVTYLASCWATFAGGPVYFDSLIMFVFLLLSARMIEARVHSKSTAALRALTELVPLTAEKLVDYPASRRTLSTPAAELQIDDCVQIAPGAQIPADGAVVEGESECDESLMTGESHPVPKKAGAKLIGGAMNLGGFLVMRIERVGDATQLSTLVRMMENAANEKPPLVALADRHASVFMTVILVLAMLAGVAWWWIDPSRALWIAVTVMVITCPCALSLATPGVMSGAVGQLARRGVLVARGRAVETLARATHFVFDKTGTLTEGKLHLVKMQILRSNVDEAACLKLVAAVVGASLHPVGKALARATADRAIALENEGPAYWQEIPGQGIEAHLNQQRLRLGNIGFVQALSNADLNVPEEFAGKTLAALGDAQGWIALFAFEDVLRADAKNCIEFLQQMGKKVLLLSGDKEDVVAQFSQKLNISAAYGDLRPEQKHDMVKALQQQGAVVAMIGDGMNDGPVLSLADVSIAMGQGAPISQARSDLVLMSSRLQDLQAAVQVTGKSLKLIYQNLSWAVLYNVIAIPAAVAGLLLPWQAAIGMSLSSLIVVMNSLRILRD
ncbi:MAG: cadmium-translocating P-type ATPase [Burkholderiales bacterium]|nr:cadmium-translocating P-type ATPase [Burkholderiales bacterium]